MTHILGNNTSEVCREELKRYFPGVKKESVRSIKTVWFCYEDKRDKSKINNNQVKFT
jgi:hypothetical protein